MIDYSIQNKQAWEYNAYEFWVEHSGTPVDRAKKALENPVGMLKRYSDYFDTYSGIKIASAIRYKGSSTSFCPPSHAVISKQSSVSVPFVKYVLNSLPAIGTIHEYLSLYLKNAACVYSGIS